VILTDEQRKKVETIRRDVGELAYAVRDALPETDKRHRLAARIHAAADKLTEALRMNAGTQVNGLKRQPRKQKAA
jgi:hypothetical protein